MTFVEESLLIDARLGSCSSPPRARACSFIEALGRAPDEARLASEPPDDPDIIVDGDALEREVEGGSGCRSGAA